MSITPESIIAHDQSEYAQQVAFFCWASTSDIPDIDLMYAIPNGEARSKATGGRLKAAGVKPGVPDICWPVATVRIDENARGNLKHLHTGVHSYHGLYIEMKVGRNTPSMEQDKYIIALTRQGYYVALCYSWEEARDVVVWYNSLR